MSNNSFDRRIVNRNIRGGRVTQKDYDTHLKNLPDLADSVTEFELESEMEAAAAEKTEVAGDSPAASADDSAEGQATN